MQSRLRNYIKIIDERITRFGVKLIYIDKIVGVELYKSGDLVITTVAGKYYFDDCKFTLKDFNKVLTGHFYNLVVNELGVEIKEESL